MARKKDFTGIAAGKVKDTIAEATADPAQEAPKAQEKRKARKTYTAQEAADILEERKSAGRKGVKLPRYNVAFAPSLYEYIQTMARAAGMSYTDFINMVLQQHKDDHADAYKKAIEFRKSL